MNTILNLITKIIILKCERFQILQKPLFIGAYQFYNMAMFQMLTLTFMAAAVHNIDKWEDPLSKKDNSLFDLVFKYSAKHNDNVHHVHEILIH